MQTTWMAKKNGRFALLVEDQEVLLAHARAFHTDGRRIDTRFSSCVKEEKQGDALTLTFRADNGLVLTERLWAEDGVPYASCAVSEEGKPVKSRCLIPLVVQQDEAQALPLWKSIWQKMLLVPYDNTMWLRYEAAPLRAGRESYDVTVLFDEESRAGLLIGAVDFSCWKNALVCSAYDAKTLEAVSGVADAGSHDTLPHGAVAGESVESAPFAVLYGPDYRRLLERYGDIVREKTPWQLSWDAVPFGFNSWAGLAFRLNEKNFRETGRFLREELAPAGYGNEGVTYTNLDAGWSDMSPETLADMAKELHANGQKAGIYDAPFAFFGREADRSKEIPGAPGHTFEEILLRDGNGDPLPRVDGAIPLDVTHPVWKQQMAWKLARFVEWGYDYVKLDFLSHGGMEGVHADAAVRTGREAIQIGYRFLDACLSPERIGRPFFISLSIAPLFPCGYGHARRFSCDAFGTDEDVEYVLNAQTYAWWQNRRLYAFNDPDHICLLKSFGMERDSSEGEARARYTAAAIAGTVMMLSDDYERPEARTRARMFSGNRAVNRVAASRVSFLPVEANNGSASHAFTAEIEGTPYLALFHWERREEALVLDLSRAGLPAGTYADLWSGARFETADGALCWQVKGCDALLLKKE